MNTVRCWRRVPDAGGMTVIMLAVIVVVVTAVLLVQTGLHNDYHRTKVQAQSDLTAIAAAQYLRSNVLVSLGQEPSIEQISRSCVIAQLLVDAADMQMTECSHVGEGKMRVRLSFSDQTGVAVAGPRAADAHT